MCSNKDSCYELTKIKAGVIEFRENMKTYLSKAAVLTEDGDGFLCNLYKNMMDEILKKLSILEVSLSQFYENAVLGKDKLSEYFRYIVDEVSEFNKDCLKIKNMENDFSGLDKSLTKEQRLDKVRTQLEKLTKFELESDIRSYLSSENESNDRESPEDLFVTDVKNTIRENFFLIIGELFNFLDKEFQR